MTLFIQVLRSVVQHRDEIIQLGLAAFNQEFGTQWAELMAASVMVTVPVIALFLYAQRFLVRGLATPALRRKYHGRNSRQNLRWKLLANFCRDLRPA